MSGLIEFKEYHRNLHFGPLLFIIYVNDLFFLYEKFNVCNYPGDTTFCGCSSNLKTLILRQELFSTHIKIKQEVN